LLLVLAAHPRRVFSRSQLLDLAWGRDHFVTLRTVDVHIRRLREKMEEDPAKPSLVQTVRGFGYRFSPIPTADPDE
jgi:DNA-binding response OmpR family regulator